MVEFENRIELHSYDDVVLGRNNCRYCISIER